MKIKASVPLMIASILFLTACLPKTVKPLAPGELAVKIQPDTNVEIVQTFARQDGEKILVEGKVQRKKVHGRMIPRGHVDIAIIDEQGKTIHQTYTRVSPEILPTMHGEKSSFMAQIPMIAPQGSIVKVKFERHSR